MSSFTVHRCRLFEYAPCAIQCLAACEITEDLAVARSDGSVEIWNPGIAWFIKIVSDGVVFLCLRVLYHEHCT